MFKFLVLAQAGQSPRQPGLFDMAVPLVLMFIIMYVILIKPQQRKQKEQDDLIKTLKAGDRIVTNGGIHGTITGVKEETITVRIADNVKVELNRTSVSAVTPAAISDKKAKGK